LLCSITSAAPPTKTQSSAGKTPVDDGSGHPIIEQAKRSIEAQEPDQAIPLLKRFLGGSPPVESIDDVYYLLGAAFYNTKEYGDAVKNLAQLLHDYPESELVDRAKVLLAKSHAGMGNIDLALPLLAQVKSLTKHEDVKLEALKLTGDYHLQKKDYLRVIQVWVEEMSLAQDEQAQEPRTRIAELINGQLDHKTLQRIRDTYPKSFPGDLALIRLIDFHQARGEDHLLERDIRQFLDHFPSHDYAGKAADLLAAVKMKLKTHEHVLAAIFPLSGKLGPFGTEVLNGIQLAFEKHKETPGAGPVGLIVKDTEVDQAGFLTELSDLLTESRPLAVVGPLLSKNLPVMAEMAEKTKTPVITPAAMFPNVRRLGGYLFSTALTYNLQAKRIVDFAMGEQGYRRFVILHPDTTYGRELAKLFAREVRQSNGEIIAIETYKEGDADFGPTIKRVKEADLKKYGTQVRLDNAVAPLNPRDRGARRMLYTPGFDAVFIPGRHREVSLIAPQLAFHDVVVPLFGGNGWNNQELGRLADRTLDGSTFVDGFFIDSANANVQDFVDRYQRRYQAAPSLFAAQGYDAAGLVLDALRRGATTGEAVREFFATQHGLPTLTGPASFGPDGTLNRRVLLLQIKRGKFVELD
jgi:ABC-type branched-subunit amino acid transport system substrate-binding protein/predicted negative regulator of RcsB-dependent stress response